MLEANLADRQVVQYIIRRFGIHAKHKLGQNFLIRPDIVAAIALIDTRHTVGASAIYRGSGSGVQLKFYVDGRVVSDQTNQDPSYSTTV